MLDRVLINLQTIWTWVGSATERHLHFFVFQNTFLWRLVGASVLFGDKLPELSSYEEGQLASISVPASDIYDGEAHSIYVTSRHLYMSARAMRVLDIFISFRPCISRIKTIF